MSAEKLPAVNESLEDQSLSQRRGDGPDSDLWRGWTLETCQDGQLFYYHASTETSQWQMPDELIPTLGIQAPTAQANGAGFWWTKEVLGSSSKTDPRSAANLFQ